MYVIYALVDPRDNSIFYVGITADVYERFKQHMQCEGGNPTKNARIMELRAENRLPVMEELERVESKQNADERETYWIKHFSMLAEPLVNMSKKSPPRRAKKTHLRFGRTVKMETSQSVMALRSNGDSLRVIAQKLGLTYYQVQEIYSQSVIDGCCYPINHQLAGD